MNELTPYSPWIFYTVATICILFVGISKAGFGGGVGVLATPLMSLVVSPMVAAGILLPLLCACDFFSVWPYRHSWDRRSLRMLVPGALVGIAMGAMVLWLFRGHTAQAEKALRLTIGAISILFVVHQVGRGWLLSHLPPSEPKSWLGHLLGMLAGVVSTLAHAGGPPISMFLLPQQLDRQRFVGTSVVFFTIANYTKLVPYALLDMMPMANLRISLILLPVVPVGVVLGVYLNRIISQQLFNRIVYVVLFLTGLQLITNTNIIEIIRHLVS